MKWSTLPYRVIAAWAVTCAFGLTFVDVSGAAPLRLIATVGPGATVTLKTLRGARVAKLRAGSYTFVVRDRSARHNFHLLDNDPLLPDKRTGIAFVGVTSWTVRLRKGLYRYVCDAHPSTMKGSFKVI
jgi:hypothetical protein